MMLFLITLVGGHALALLAAPIVKHSVPTASTETSTAEAHDLVLRGGQVWTGTEFRAGTLSIREGRFAADADEDSPVLDVSELYVLPPLADAHTHRFASRWDAADSRQSFLASGLLFAANLCGPSTARAECADSIGGAAGIEVRFANGGLTATDGHPIRLYENLHTNIYRQPLDTFWESNLDNTFYVVDELADFERAWAKLHATKPDFVKLLLSSSEEFLERRDDRSFYGRKGLDPQLVPHVVEHAHKAGLRVVAHVDTRADFAHAVGGGVDWVVHTPGYVAQEGEPADRYLLTDEDIQLALDQRIVQVTTASLARSAFATSLVRQNLAALHGAGVTIVVGSDQWENAAVLEREALLELDLFEPHELLRLWCEETPRAICPDRPVGRFDEGYEGHCIVLGDDPVADPRALADVRYVIKAGQVVWSAEELER